MSSLPAIFQWPFGSKFPSQSEQSPQKSPDTEETPVSSLLQHYDVTSVLPPSSRVNPSLKQQQRQPLGLLDVWRYGLFVACKATEVASEVVSHHIWGPRRKSWGIEMTMITSFMRNAGQHSHLIDMATLRKLISLAGFVPLPSDALVTPVTFRVRRRKLRGLLSKLDAVESGTRELSGEWVVGKRIWKALQREWKTSQRNKGQPAEKSTRNRLKEHVILYLHGGAYYLFSAATHRLITIQLSKHVGARVFAVDYRLAPETRFPGQLQDSVYAYLRLVEDLHIPPENIILAGDSAGGGLTLGLLMYLRDNEYPLPSGVILLSPWVDLTMSCDSWDSNAQYDIVPLPAPGDHLNPVACYLGEEGLEKYLTHPYASPLFGDFKGLPPMLIQSGDSEVLRDEITLLAHKATMAGVDVHHELYEDAVHVFQTFPFLDASRKAFLACRDFVKNVLPRRPPQVLDMNAQQVLKQEIVNDKATIVRGDGSEMRPDPDTSYDLDTSSDTTDEGSRERSDDEPSWRHSFAPRDAVDDSGVPTTDSDPAERPIIRRLRSTFSLFSLQPEVDETPSTPTTPVTPSTAMHKAQPAGQPRHHSRRPSGNVRLSALSIISSTANLPTPTIRSRNRTISHPDISSLCDQWAIMGPANQTTMYAPNTPVSPTQPR
ncbi:hypothetical protein BD410DRAFT_782035 [Rickenella mellea]|uniref:Alpha/beta hydrolase fold-3 domain-containing protein n=1 Tax=Rickenella mellea TaxID=50990 RepID=A0A4Y7QK89_9AGAM|nr:hypothetical protein BD410DRAFT_782035 [Rickenella mellea]